MHHLTLRENTSQQFKAFQANPNPQGRDVRAMTSEEVDRYSDFVKETFAYMKDLDNQVIDHDKAKGKLDTIKKRNVSGFSGNYTALEEKKGEYTPKGANRSYNLVETHEVRHENPNSSWDQTTYNFGVIDGSIIAGANYDIKNNTLRVTEFRIDTANPENSVIREGKPATARGL